MGGNRKPHAGEHEGAYTIVELHAPEDEPVVLLGDLAHGYFGGGGRARGEARNPLGAGRASPPMKSLTLKTVVDPASMTPAKLSRIYTGNANNTGKCSPSCGDEPTLYNEWALRPFAFPIMWG